MTISLQTPVTAVGELEPSLLGALCVTQAGLAAMFSGDLEPYIACWADSADATLLGAWGPVEKGSRALIDTFRWVGDRFAGGRSPVQATVETTVISCAVISPTPSDSNAGRCESMEDPSKKWSSESPTSGV
jgi:hypothetical protein